MPRWLRWVLVVVAAAVVGLVVLLALLPAFVDVNRYKGEVIARVEAGLGREITLERLSLAFLPAPTLGLEGLVVGERGAPTEGPIPPGERFVALERLGLRLRLLPLLSRRIEVSRLRLDRPEIVVERDAKGTLSIADLLAPRAGAAPREGGAAGAGPSALGGLLVERIEVRGGRLTFRDRAVVPGREVTTTIADLDASLADVSLDRPVRADVRATFLSRTPGNVRLAGRVGPLGPGLDLTAAPLEATVEASDLDLRQVAAYAGARAGAPQG
ncbi:MAG TPA: AsmA family protein, partial [Thermodesulfobacteriota bacterium]|nr:AsmA family protein [Thermodesulfobacteriota bacterium]